MKYLATERAARRAEFLEYSSPQLYTRNRHGQYELFPKKKPVKSYVAICLVLSLVVLLLFTIS